MDKLKESRKYGLFKATRDTNLWKKGQKLWVDWTTGALAAPAVGRHKGTGRWIRGWIHWEDIDNPGKSFVCKIDAKYIGEIKITGQFNKKLQEYLWGKDNQ